ncbi:hypothetical protein SAMN05444166_7605 [Singulisphaera sp. GP187]|nr:hypothetical protein SAMN05444166_7605 [Singulisphaera sp. GP187]
MSLIFYVIPIAILAEPESRTIAAKAFGSPVGISPRIFAFLIFTILYIPFPFVFWHAITIAMKTHDDGNGLGSIALLVDLFEVGKRHPSLRRSQFFVFGGLAYFVLICLTWIVYCSIRGM